MPSSAVLNFADPYAYQKAVQAADLQVFVAERGTFEATLTRIKLDRLWMQRARFSLPAVTHSAVGKDRSMIFLQFDLDQAPIYPAHAMIRNSVGFMIRKLSVTSSQ